MMAGQCGRNATEDMLCPSRCIVPRGTRCPSVPLLVIITSLIDRSGILPPVGFSDHDTSQPLACWSYSPWECLTGLGLDYLPNGDFLTPQFLLNLSTDVLPYGRGFPPALNHRFVCISRGFLFSSVEYQLWPLALTFMSGCSRFDPWNTAFCS